MQFSQKQRWLWISTWMHSLCRMWMGKSICHTALIFSTFLLQLFTLEFFFTVNSLHTYKLNQWCYPDQAIQNTSVSLLMPCPSEVSGSPVINASKVSSHLWGKTKVNLPSVLQGFFFFFAFVPLSQCLLFLDEITAAHLMKWFNVLPILYWTHPMRQISIYLTPGSHIM